MQCGKLSDIRALKYRVYGSRNNNNDNIKNNMYRFCMTPGV
jgi:hypothetical protein